MITLDQVQKLEKKVNDAVDLINRFKAEKVVLEENIEKYEFRILELEEITEQLNKDQNEIEDKFIGALNQLEDLNNGSETVIVNSENDTLLNDEPSADISVSEKHEIVETEALESKESVDYSKVDEETEEENYDEVVENEVDIETALSENEDDNQPELQESTTEDPQDGLPMNDDEETVEEDVVPTVDSEFGEMPEDESVKENKLETDLFEQSLDIF